jgi:outer membrane protein assembly factor BamB
MLGLTPSGTRNNALEKTLNPANIGQLQTKWSTPLQVFASSPSVVGGILYVGSGNSVLALDATTGKTIWSYVNSDSYYFQSTPAVAGGIVYIGSDDFYLYALNAATGALVWKQPQRVPSPPLRRRSPMAWSTWERK